MAYLCFVEPTDCKLPLVKYKACDNWVITNCVFEEALGIVLTSETFREIRYGAPYQADLEIIADC